jgi:nicotinamidase-related amidase
MSVTQPNTVTDKNVYILITQCLQNGFFLADGNRLCLPHDIVLRMLVGDLYGKNKDIDRTTIGKPDKLNRRAIDEKLLKAGPLYQFFESLTGSSKRKHPLHIIPIRDWHAPSEQYDEERTLYGVHCEADTWEAAPIDGFGKFLLPWGTDSTQIQQARSLKGYRCKRENDKLVSAEQDGDIFFYDVRSDSVFDFKEPGSAELLKVRNTVLSQSADKKQTAVSHLQLVLDELIIEQKPERVYVVVAGVYTDIKIKTLLIGLRTRYNIDGLFVSDVLTDAPNLERHLSGLDFADKVLNAHIMHSLNDVVSVLSPGAEHVIEDEVTATTVNFRNYASYFLDRKNVLAFQDQRLLKYVELTGTRSAKIYSQIETANRFLMIIGGVFMILTIILVIIQAIAPIFHWPDVPAGVILATTGLPLAQIITSFFWIPSLNMRNNLHDLVRLRNYLETYSNVTALLRYHLTKAERLQPNTADPVYKERAELELSLLSQQLDIIHKAAQDMSKTFFDLTPNPKEPKKLPDAKADAEAEQSSNRAG